MRVPNPMSLLLIFALLVVLSGCNGNEGQNLPVNTLAVSQKCVECHAANVMRISPVTGGVITDEWLNSPHNTTSSANKSGIGSGCPNCHTPSHNHPDDCGQCHGGSPAIAASFINPDEMLQCNVCHAPSSSIKPLGAPHFNNFTGVRHQAQYVDLQNVGKCRNCHNSHNNTVLREEKDWAVSMHGDVNGVAWTTEDFKTNADCIRCHTTTGYINYVTSTPVFTLPTAPLAASETYGVLGCNACHASYDFKNTIRNVPQYTAPYNNGQSPQSYPDLGFTNICMPCHAGRESGDTINAVTDITNVSFKSSHNMAVAGLMYMKIGFTSFTSASAVIGSSTYGKSLSPDTSVPGGIVGGVSSTHRKLGTTAINGDNHNPAFFVAGVLDANGPCVTCHMNANGQPYRTTSHGLKINSDAYNQVCTNCHTSEGGIALSGSNFQAVFLEPQSTGFRNALALAASLLQTEYNIKYDPANDPYFFDLSLDPAGRKPVTDWTRGGTINQKLALKLMGACFNINLLNGDPAAYAHARTYTRRLIYDTIDFLDDGKLNLSVSTTATAIMPATFGKGANAYTDGTLTTLSPGTTESMIFLIGWNRTTGKWSTPERP